MNINEADISKGMEEVARLKAWANEAVEMANKAKDEAKHFRGQVELLMRQKSFDDDRHQKDLQRIAELEAALTSMLETFALAEAKLRNRKASINSEDQLDADIRRLATARLDAKSSERIVSNQGRG